MIGHLPSSLNVLPSTVRWFLTAFLATITFGYVAGVYFVSHTTDFSAEGTVQQFRGNEDVPISEVEEIKYGKDTLEMMNVIHTHVTSFALIYLAVGGIFLFGSFDPRLKAFLALEPFVATLLLFGSMTGLRFFGDETSEAFAWLMLVAGLTTTLCFLAMVGLSVFDIWRPDESVTPTTE